MATSKTNHKRWALYDNKLSYLSRNRYSRCLGIRSIRVGASFIILPALGFIFTRLFPHTVAIKMAIATCLFSALPIAINTSRHYHKNQKLNFGLLYWIIPGYFVGGILAPLIVRHLPSQLLHIIIGTLLILFAITLFIRSWLAFKRPQKNISAAPASSLPIKTKQANGIILCLASVGMATLCGSAGIGTGILMVPYLSRYVEHFKAVAINLNSGIFFILFASINYIIAGWHVVPHSPSLTQWGYIYVPAAVMIGLPAWFIAPLAVRWAHRLPVNRLKMLFSILVLVAGIDLLW